MTKLFQNDRFFAATNENSVKSYMISDGSVDATLVRFTAPVTHMCFNSTGKRLYACAR